VRLEKRYWDNGIAMSTTASSTSAELKELTVGV